MQTNDIVEQERPAIFTASEILYLLRTNWYWFVVSLLICLGVAFLYHYQAPRLYERQASVLIKSQSQISSALKDLQSFTDIGGQAGGFNMKNEVDNELIIFGTHRLIAAVVDELRLDVTYESRQDFRLVNMYKRSPILATFVDANPEEVISFVVEPVDEARYTLTDVYSAHQEEIADISGKYGDTISTAIGNICIAKTPYFSTLTKEEEIRVQKERKEATVEQYVKALRVSLASKTSTIINLSLRSRSPLLAEDFLSTLIQLYDEDERNDKVRIARKTEQFIDDRLRLISSELGNVDDEILRYKQTNEIADIGTEARSFIEGSAQLVQQQAQVANQLSMARFVLDYLNNPAYKDELIPSNIGIQDDNSNSQISQYNSLLLKYEKLTASSADNNPVITDLNNQLEAMRRAVLKTMTNLIKSLEIKASSISQQDMTNRSRISSVPMQETVIGSIYRQQKIKEGLYLFLLNVREKNALEIEASSGDARVIDPAYGTLAPISPKAPMIYMAALLMGILLPGGILYLLFLMDGTLRGRKDVEDACSSPILGEIPHLKGYRKFNKNRDKATKRGGKNAVSRPFFVAGVSDRSAASEAFTLLRTNMLFMNATVKRSEGVQVVLVASAVANSGKTFVTGNLALSMARTGKRVLVIDGDLRKGGDLTKSMQAYMPAYSSRGLSGYLSDTTASTEGLIIQSAIADTLYLMPSGAVPPNAADLFLTARFDKIIEDLRTEFDYIIIDSSPIFQVADAQIMSRISDMCLFVIREGLLKRSMLYDIEQLIQTGKIDHIGYVINNVGVKNAIYGGAYGYGYGYGYGDKGQ